MYPKALAGRLTRRQDALNRDIDEAVRSVQGKDVAPEETRFAARMKSLAKRQDDIARLTRTIVPPAGKEGKNRFPNDAARDAVEKTTRAAQSLQSQRVQELEGRKNEARQALERLANELHDPWRRQEPTRQKFEEARRISNEVAEEIGRHLRETAPRADHLSTASHAAEELAGRLHDTADKEARAVAALEATEPEPRALPQRDRALTRAQALAGILRDLRDPTKRESARNVLAAVEAEAHVTMDRFEQKLNGRAPDDDVAAELADDQKAIHQEVEKQEPADLARSRIRLAAGQRSLAGCAARLNIPDATLSHKAEAVRLAERAAEVLDSGATRSDPRAALAQAAEAARALARQLVGDQPPRARAAGGRRGGGEGAPRISGRPGAGRPGPPDEPVAAEAGQAVDREKAARDGVPPRRGRLAGQRRALERTTTSRPCVRADPGPRGRRAVRRPPKLEACCLEMSPGRASQLASSFLARSPQSPATASPKSRPRLRPLGVPGPAARPSPSGPRAMLGARGQPGHIRAPGGRSPARRPGGDARGRARARAGDKTPVPGSGPPRPPARVRARRRGTGVDAAAGRFARPGKARRSAGCSAWRARAEGLPPAARVPTSGGGRGRGAVGPRASDGKPGRRRPRPRARRRWPYGQARRSAVADGFPQPNRAMESPPATYWRNQPIPTLGGALSASRPRPARRRRRERAPTTTTGCPRRGKARAAWAATPEASRGGAADPRPREQGAVARKAGRAGAAAPSMHARIAGPAQRPLPRRHVRWSATFRRNRRPAAPGSVE